MNELGLEKVESPIKLPKGLDIEKLVKTLQPYKEYNYVVCQDKFLFWTVYPGDAPKDMYKLYPLWRLFKDTEENSNCYSVKEFIDLLEKPCAVDFEAIEKRILSRMKDDEIDALAYSLRYQNAELKFVKDLTYGTCPKEVTQDFVFGGDKCAIKFGCAMEKPVKQWPPDERATTNGMVDIPFLLSRQ